MLPRVIPYNSAGRQLLLRAAALHQALHTDTAHLYRRLCPQFAVNGTVNQLDLVTRQIAFIGLNSDGYPHQQWLHAFCRLLS